MDKAKAVTLTQYLELLDDRKLIKYYENVINSICPYYSASQFKIQYNMIKTFKKLFLL